jgi:hypothetical protein
MGEQLTHAMSTSMPITVNSFASIHAMKYAQTSHCETRAAAHPTWSSATIQAAE